MALWLSGLDLVESTIHWLQQMVLWWSGTTRMKLASMALRSGYGDVVEMSWSG